MAKTYTLKYKVYGIDNVAIKSGKMKVKNCDNELHAKLKLDKYLSKKIEGFGHLIIDSCEQYEFKDIFDIFDNMLDIIKNGR